MYYSKDRGGRLHMYGHVQCWWRVHGVLRNLGHDPAVFLTVLVLKVHEDTLVPQHTQLLQFLAMALRQALQLTDGADAAA